MIFMSTCPYMHVYTHAYQTYIHTVTQTYIHATYLYTCKSHMMIGHKKSDKRQWRSLLHIELHLFQNNQTFPRVNECIFFYRLLTTLNSRWHHIRQGPIRKLEYLNTQVKTFSYNIWTINFYLLQAKQVNNCQNSMLFQ